MTALGGITSANEGAGASRDRFDFASIRLTFFSVFLSALRTLEDQHAQWHAHQPCPHRWTLPPAAPPPGFFPLLNTPINLVGQPTLGWRRPRSQLSRLMDHDLHTGGGSPSRRDGMPDAGGRSCRTAFVGLL